MKLIVSPIGVVCFVQFLFSFGIGRIDAWLGSRLSVDIGFSPSVLGTLESLIVLGYKRAVYNDK